MDIKNIMKNVTPSITVMVVGVLGAYFVYNTYFSEKVASNYAGFEPAAGEEVVVDEMTTEDVIEEATDMEVKADDMMEAAEEMKAEGEAMVEEGEAMEEKAEEMHEDAAEMKEEATDGETVTEEVIEDVIEEHSEH